MDVETFITESLVAIANGIRSANDSFKEPETGNRHTYFILGANNQAQTIDFDIAVSATKTGGGGATAKGSVAVVAIEIGAKGEATHHDASRIKFSVLVARGLT